MNFGEYTLRSPIAKRDDIVVMYAITPEGRRVAEAFSDTGPRFAVLSALNGESSISVQGICRETRLESSKVKAVLKELIHKGYAQKKVQKTMQQQGENSLGIEVT